MRYLLAIILTTSVLLGANKEEDESKIIDELFYMDIIKINDIQNKSIEVLDNGDVIEYYIDGVRYTLFITNDIKNDINISIQEANDEKVKVNEADRKDA